MTRIWTSSPNATSNEFGERLYSVSSTVSETGWAWAGAASITDIMVSAATAQGPIRRILCVRTRARIRPSRTSGGGSSAICLLMFAGPDQPRIDEFGDERVGSVDDVRLPEFVRQTSGGKSRRNRP